MNVPRNRAEFRDPRPVGVQLWLSSLLVAPESRNCPPWSVKIFHTDAPITRLKSRRSHIGPLDTMSVQW
jgi:hypothetical protein